MELTIFNCCGAHFQKSLKSETHQLVFVIDKLDIFIWFCKDFV